MDRSSIVDIILRGKESRNVEMKESMDLGEKPIKAKIAKAAMGMANIRDGGVLILGMKKTAGDDHLPEGMTADHVDAYQQDRVASIVMAYAEPYVELSVTRFEPDEPPVLSGRIFIIIDFKPFSEIPVICKKQYQGAGLRVGGIYIRSRERFETREVQTEAEMRELLELAAEKRLRRHLQVTANAGGVVVPVVPFIPRDADQFNEELQDLQP